MLWFTYIHFLTSQQSPAVARQTTHAHKGTVTNLPQNDVQVVWNDQILGYLTTLFQLQNTV